MPMSNSNLDSRELLSAAYHGELDWIQNCINGGLDIHVRDEGGMTALHWVVDMGMVDESKEREEIFKFLIERGADIHAQDYAERSVLWVAVMAGNIELIKILVEAGADVNQPDNSGVKPLHLAISDGHREAIRVLKRAGATFY